MKLDLKWIGKIGFPIWVILLILKLFNMAIINRIKVIDNISWWWISAPVLIMILATLLQLAYDKGKEKRS